MSETVGMSESVRVTSQLADGRELTVHVRKSQEIASLHPDEITGFDYFLTQAELNTDIATIVPGLHKYPTEEVEAGIDAVYVAAGAGNERAKNMIQRSAELAGKAACVDAFDGDRILSDDELSDILMDVTLAARVHAAIPEPNSVEYLDHAIATIEGNIAVARLFADEPEHSAAAEDNNDLHTTLEEDAELELEYAADAEMLRGPDDSDTVLA